MTEHEDRPPTTVVVQPAQGVVGIAGDTIAALRATPMLLVMILLNCVFIAAAAFYLKNQQDGAFKLVDKMFDRCLPDVHAEAFERHYTPTPKPDPPHEGSHP